MDWHILMAVVAGILSVVGTVPYIKDMLYGTTRPNVVSWSLWWLIQIVLMSAQFAAGASYSVILPIMGLILITIVVGLGLRGYGYKKYGALDVACVGLVLAALALWKITNDPLMALWLTVAADFFASVPTFIKAYKDPKSESWLAYFIVIFSALAGFLSSTIHDVANLLWPTYIMLGNGFILLLIYLGKKKK